MSAVVHEDKLWAELARLPAILAPDPAFAALYEPKGTLGFRVYRNNDIIYNNGVSGDLPFEKVLQFKGTWVDSDTKAAASEFTVPADGAGLYVLAGGAYWGVANNVYCAVSVNDVATAGAIPTGDRHWTCAPHFLDVGDRVSLWINNQSGGNRTVSAIGGDAQTPVSPFLAVWRVTT